MCSCTVDITAPAIIDMASATVITAATAEAMAMVTVTTDLPLG